GNLGNGIELRTLSDYNTIGGTTPGARNLITGNFSDGVLITILSEDNLVEGNYIGTNIQGTGPLRNGQDGVAVLDASDDTVGGTVQGAGNVISGNYGNGISFTDAPASDVV